MRLVPWREKETGLGLFSDLEDFQREMNRLFDVTLRNPKAGNGKSMIVPAVDIIDEKDQIKVKAELPGMKKEEIEVNLEDDILSIKGEKKEEKEIKEKDYMRSERYYGAFNRSFSLPATVDAQKVNASYKDGILEITLTKKEGAKPKQIKVDIK